jgi:CubicO group peptidase (beta-lactamase class C family)
MTLASIFLAVTALVPPAAYTASESRFPGATWEHVDPASAGWSPEKLAEAREEFDRSDFAAVLVVDHGRIVASFGDVSQRLPVRSMRKSLLNALIGILIDRGKLRLDATLAELGIDDDEPSLSAAEKSARLRDLLTSRSGVYHPAAYETRDQTATRPRRGAHPPGTYFYYNNWDFNALGTIVNRAAGRSLFEFFRDEIATPLGMQDFSLADTEWKTEAGSRHPAYLFSMSARDLARFGLLYLEEGTWGERRILPASWVRESVRPHVDRLRVADYGYLWWSQEPLTSRGQRERVFMARGNGAQRIWVIPEQRLVMVFVTNTRLMLARDALGLVPSSEEFFRLLHLLMDASP